MPRRLTLQTREMGPVELYLIYNEGGTWESQWRAFQGVWDLPEVSKEMMDQALCGWTRPLVDALGPPPKGKLLKLPVETRTCASAATCPMHIEKDCGHLLTKMPWCFVPKGTPASELAAEVIKLWREKVYVVVVNEPSHAS